MRFLTSCIFALFAGVLLSFGDVVLQQEIVTGSADYGSGSGQTFLLPPGATAAVIQLHISSIGNGGGAFLLHLWETDGAFGTYASRKGNAPVATGAFTANEIGNVPGWITVYLDKPYVNESGGAVLLAFELELLSAGTGGWNDYSFSAQNSFAAGYAVYWENQLYAIRDGVDMTFRVLDAAPEFPFVAPRLKLDFSPPAKPGGLSKVVLQLGEWVPGYRYTCFSSEDLSLPKELWQRGSMIEATAKPPRWEISYSSMPGALFYFVEIEVPE